MKDVAKGDRAESRFPLGARVRHIGDSHGEGGPASGEEGTVVLIDSEGSLHITWDRASTEVWSDEEEWDSLQIVPAGSGGPR